MPSQACSETKVIGELSATSSSSSYAQCVFPLAVFLLNAFRKCQAARPPHAVRGSGPLKFLRWNAGYKMLFMHWIRPHTAQKKSQNSSMLKVPSAEHDNSTSNLKSIERRKPTIYEAMDSL